MSSAHIQSTSILPLPPPHILRFMRLQTEGAITVAECIMNSDCSSIINITRAPVHMME